MGGGNSSRITTSFEASRNKERITTKASGAGGRGAGGGNSTSVRTSLEASRNMVKSSTKGSGGDGETGGMGGGNGAGIRRW